MIFESTIYAGDITDIPGITRSCFWCAAYIPRRAICGEHRYQFPPEGYCAKGRWDAPRLALALKLRVEGRGPLAMRTEPEVAQYSLVLGEGEGA